MEVCEDPQMIGVVLTQDLILTEIVMPPEEDVENVTPEEDVEDVTQEEDVEDVTPEDVEDVEDVPLEEEDVEDVTPEEDVILT